jgi:hypothetical protein
LDPISGHGGYPVFVPTDGKARGLDALDVFQICVEAAPNVASRGRCTSDELPQQVSVDAAITPHSNLKISQIVSFPVVF